MSIVKFLVGYTGFVGSNIASKCRFEGCFNSKNIEDAFGARPDLLVFSGIPAEKFLANNSPGKDLALINSAFDNIKKINPRALVLISTIDVYKRPIGVDEDHKIDLDGLHPYGLNRYHLETSIRQAGMDALIVRLPGLFGQNIKKNFIYDIINVIPSVLTQEKLAELSAKNDEIAGYYQKGIGNFYKCRELSQIERNELKQVFRDINFTAANFTDSRSIFQFYNLAYLWGHIGTALKHGVALLNVATEPIGASDLYRWLRDADFVNEISMAPAKYDFKTKHATLFNGENGYIFNKTSVMNEIKQFVEGMDAEI
jgi:hypothetical protein